MAKTRKPTKTARPEPSKPVACWEAKGCGREKNGAKTSELGVCPAWPDHGRDCWLAAGTLCGGVVQGTYAEKLGNCLSCEFYQKVMCGEA